MFADRIAFVDLETTGMSPQRAGITEIGLVLLWREGDTWRSEEWSSLVNPGHPIPPEIRFLTGISNEMVATAPRFAELAGELNDRLTGAVFVAHHVRFDYGFVKQAFADAGIAYTAKTLCTVRLSKLLDPDRSPHSLDALIHRHSLGDTDRHRALGDARIIHKYVTRMYERRGAEVVDAAARRLLKQPGLPAHLPAGALDVIPDGPGVYRFLGANDQPLYIGKSIHLRERVASHFVNDHRSERGVRLASEIRRIDVQRTAGDFGAQLLERMLIRTQLPAHNAALRRRSNQMVLAPVGNTDRRLVWRKVHEIDPQSLPGHFGPFNSRASAKAWLTREAAAARLCLATLGLERRVAGLPCFNRQLGRCGGCCVGAEPLADMMERLNALLAPLRLPDWPFSGGLLVREVPIVPLHEVRDAPDREATADSGELHLFHRWCYLGSAASASDAVVMLNEASAHFDADTYRLLRRALARGGLVADPAPSVEPAAAPTSRAGEWRLAFEVLPLPEPVRLDPPHVQVIVARDTVADRC